MGERQITQGVLASDGVGPCWIVVIFLGQNNIYMDHLSSVDLPQTVSYISAQHALEIMLARFHEEIESDNKNFEIQYVCLLGGQYKANHYLSKLGLMVHTLCSTPSEVLLFKTEDENIGHHLLNFMNKVAYIDLNMNYCETLRKGKHRIDNESDLTVIAESANNIYCVSIVMYVGNKMLSVYVIDPAKSRPNLVFKSTNSQLSTYEKKVRDKKMAFIDYHSLNLLFPGTCLYELNAQPTLQRILKNLIPRIIRNPSKENSSDSDEDQSEDEYQIL